MNDYGIVPVLCTHNAIFFLRSNYRLPPANLILFIGDEKPMKRSGKRTSSRYF